MFLVITFIISIIMIHMTLLVLLRGSVKEPSETVFSAKVERAILWRAHQPGMFQSLLGATYYLENRRLLEQANWRSPGNILFLYGFKLLGLLVVAAFVLYVSYLKIIASPIIVFSVLLFLLPIAWLLPNWVVNLKKKHYQHQIELSMHVFLEMLVICFDVGYGIDESFKIVAEMVRVDRKALANELEYTVCDLRFQPERRIAWQNLIDRVDLASMHAVVRTIQQYEETGSPLKASLHEQAEHMRQVIFSKHEARAAKIPALMAVVVGVAFFPIIMVLIATPTGLLMQEFFNTIAR